jgi:hypothetical protein
MLGIRRRPQGVEEAAAKMRTEVVRRGGRTPPSEPSMQHLETSKQLMVSKRLSVGVSTRDSTFYFPLETAGPTRRVALLTYFLQKISAVNVVEMKIRNAGGLAGLLPLPREIPLAVRPACFSSSESRRPDDMRRRASTLELLCSAHGSRELRVRGVAPYLAVKVIVLPS